MRVDNIIPVRRTLTSSHGTRVAATDSQGEHFGYRPEMRPPTAASTSAQAATFTACQPASLHGAKTSGDSAVVPIRHVTMVLRRAPRVARVLWCSAAFAALLALTGPTDAQGMGRNERAPQAQPSTGRYRGDVELTRLRKSAERGDAQAAWDLCTLYSGSDVESYHGRRVVRDDAVAVEWCRRAASQGHVRAGGTVGAMYYFGRGVPQDFAQAVRWTRPPATAGVSEAQYLLGLMYANGQGLPRDESQAFSWFLRSAEQGYAYAQEFVAARYLSGQGTTRDRLEAQKWLNVCATRESDARDRCVVERDANAKSMSRADLTEAQGRATQWFATCSRPSEPRWNMVCQ